MSKELLWWMSVRLWPVFSSRVVMVSYLTLVSFIKFELIFVCSIRESSTFILCMLLLSSPRTTW